MNKIIEFIEKSFLSPLLSIEDVTDISYNGNKLFYMSNKNGRQESEVPFDTNDIKNFIRQIANLTGKPFSFAEPVLDVSIGRYRFSAVHNSIARYGDKEVVTFSLRIVRSEIVALNNPYFNIPPLIELFRIAIENQISIVIGGETGSGKTELQKLIISLMKVNTRIIVIDNVLELCESQMFFPSDTNMWLCSDYISGRSTKQLINCALRNNPDWLIVAETKQGEIIDILNSVMTGHPIITTIHSFDALSIPQKMAALIVADLPGFTYSNALEAIYRHFSLFVHVRRQVSGKGEIIRYIDSIAIGDGNKEIIEIFSNDLNKQKFVVIPNKFLKKLSKMKNFPTFLKYFVKEK